MKQNFCGIDAQCYAQRYRDQADCISASVKFLKKNRGALTKAMTENAATGKRCLMRLKIMEKPHEGIE